MESEEIINNSYKDFGEKNSEKNNKISLKKIIIISSIILFNNYFMNNNYKLK